MYFYEDMDFDDYDSNSDSDSSSIVSVSTLDSSSSSGFFGSDEIESDVDLELALEELGQPQSEDEMTSENESDDGDSTNSESEAYEGDEDLHFLDDDSDDSLSAASNYEEGILPPFNLTGTICYCSSSSVAFRKEQLIIPQFIEDLTERKKWNIFVIGNVGAGKTTFIDKLCDLLEGHCTKRTEMTKYLPVYLNNDPQVYFYIKLALQELLIQHTTNSNAKFRVFENTLEMPLNFFTYRIFGKTDQDEQYYLDFLKNDIDAIQTVLNRQNNLTILIDTSYTNCCAHNLNRSIPTGFAYWDFGKNLVSELPHVKGYFLTINGNVNKTNLEEYAYEVAMVLEKSIKK